jgi:hypothetical protein
LVSLQLLFSGVDGGDAENAAAGCEVLLLVLIKVVLGEFIGVTESFCLKKLIVKAREGGAKLVLVCRRETESSKSERRRRKCGVIYYSILAFALSTSKPALAY